MPLSISLFPDLDGLDGLISDSETVLSVFLASLAIMLAFVVVGECVEWVRGRSPVERILRKSLVHRASESASAPIGQATVEDDALVGSSHT